MPRLLASAITLCITLVCLETALACPYSIRDSAFIGAGPSSLYNLYFLVDSRTASRDEELRGWIDLASGTWLERTNVRARLLRVDDPGAHEIVAGLRNASARPEKLPAAVLVSGDDDAIVLASLDGEALSQDGVMKVFARAVESPLRAAIRARIVESWCVSLLIPGDDDKENARARQAYETAAARIKGTTTELGKVVVNGPHLVSVRPDDPDEQVLLWSLGLRGVPSEAAGEGAKRAVRIATLVGRGELRGPVLEGNEITAEKLHEVFEMLGRSCSCTTSSLWLIGKQLPMEWDATMDEAVHAELGFDPQNPEAMSAMRSVLQGVGGGQAVVTDAVGLGYSETFFAPIDEVADAGEDAAPAEAAPVEAPAPPPEPGPAARPEVVPQVERLPGHAALAAIIGIALVGLVAATWVVLRRNGRG